nr:hypothetical protein CFP56_03235 [Quercus suber]
MSAKRIFELLKRTLNSPTDTLGQARIYLHRVGTISTCRRFEICLSTNALPSSIEDACLLAMCQDGKVRSSISDATPKYVLVNEHGGGSDVVRHCF